MTVAFAAYRDNQLRLCGRFPCVFGKYNRKIISLGLQKTVSKHCLVLPGIAMYCLESGKKVILVLLSSNTSTYLVTVALGLMSKNNLQVLKNIEIDRASSAAIRTSEKKYPASSKEYRN